MPDAHLHDADLTTIPAAVDEALRVYCHERRPSIQEIGSPVEVCEGYLESFVLGGGKRIRPLYAWAGFLGGDGLRNSEEDPNSVLRAVASLEFIQACALIHDDIIDASDTRRGKPTVHRMAEAFHRLNHWQGSSARSGESIAILVGDLALIWAEDMLQDSGLSSAALRRIREPWRAMRTEVIGGQILDISLEVSGEESLELAENVNRYKTAAYTIERPLHLGAAIAGASSSLIDAFRGYGRNIGIAYQLRDDLLGIFGDPAVTGKPAGDDLREGKRTVLLALALRHLDKTDPASAARLRAGVGTVRSSEDISELTAIIAGSGAVEDVEKRIALLTETGLHHLTEAHIDSTVTAFLQALAIKSTERKA